MGRVELPPTPASSTPETITVTGLGGVATLANVLFGDVWMCGGQSNMEVPLDETFEWFHPDVSNDTDYPIRVMVFPHVEGRNDSTIHVADDAPIPWLNSTYENLNAFSSVCYYYGKALHKRMAAEGEVVPMGLVKNCWGGSLIEVHLCMVPCGGRVALVGVHLFCAHCRLLQTESCAVPSFPPFFQSGGGSLRRFHGFVLSLNSLLSVCAEATM